MTTRRLLVLWLLLMGGLSAVFLLPKVQQEQPTGIDLKLPEFVGEWYGTDLAVSDFERQTLGPETEFSRKLYTNGRGDEMQVSVVLSGHDMNNSIHRPERCLPAQGWTIVDKSSMAIAVPTRGRLNATRLHDTRMVVPAPDQQPIPIYNLNYYWFVGYTDLTGSHFDRTRIDVVDRLVKGYNQRWAYVTVAATITDGLKRFGRTEKETDALIKDFIQKLVPLTHKDSVKFD